jgi:cell division protein FtsN
MAQAKRKSGGGGRKKPNLNRPWVLILIGLGIGLASAYLWQLVTERNLHRTVASWFKSSPPARADKEAKQETEKPKSRFDFYTILPELDAHSPPPARKDPKTAKPEKPKTEEGVVYILQAGSFETHEKADELKARLALQGLQTYIQKVSLEGKGERHRVLLGPYEKLEERDAVVEQLDKLGIKPLRLTGRKSAG